MRVATSGAVTWGVAWLLLPVGCGARTGTEDDPPTIAEAGVDAAIDAGAPDAAPDCDRDDDGYRAVACGGDDCRDDDPAYHPGAADEMGWVLWTLGTDWVGYGHAHTHHILRVVEEDDGAALWHSVSSGELETWAPDGWQAERVASVPRGSASSLTPDIITFDSLQLMRIAFVASSEDGGAALVYGVSPDFGVEFQFETIAPASASVSNVAIALDFGADVTFARAGSTGIVHASRSPAEDPGWP